jgi:hypothetical protein
MDASQVAMLRRAHLLEEGRDLAREIARILPRNLGPRVFESLRPLRERGCPGEVKVEARDEFRDGFGTFSAAARMNPVQAGMDGVRARRFFGPLDRVSPRWLHAARGGA